MKRHKCSSVSRSRVTLSRSPRSPRLTSPGAFRAPSVTRTPLPLFSTYSSSGTSPAFHAKRFKIRLDPTQKLSTNSPVMARHILVALAVLVASGTSTTTTTTTTTTAESIFYRKPGTLETRKERNGPMGSSPASSASRPESLES